KDLKLIDYIGLMCPRDTNVLIDFENKARTSLTVMGAYSVALFEDYDLSASFLVEPVNTIGACYPDFTPVKIAVSNNGIFPFNFALNPLSLHLEISGPINYQHDTIISAGTLNEMLQDTFVIADMVPVYINGDYDINIWLSCAIDTIHSDDSLNYTYNVNKINLPLDLSFSSIPAEMTFHKLTGSLNWEVVSGSETNPSISPVFGSGRLRFASASGKGSMAQVVTQPLDLQGTYSPKLEFWYAHDTSAADARDQINVYISTDGGLNYTSLINVFRYDSNFIIPAWKHYQIDLSAYVSYSCVTFSFEAQSYGGNNQNIDRIRVSAAPDIKISQIEVPGLQNCDFNNKTLKVIVANNTSQAFDFTENFTTLYLTFLEAGGNIQNFSYLLNGKILKGGETDTIIVGNNFNFSTHGNYMINAYLNSVDSNRINDTLSHSILINPDIAITYIRDVDPKSTGDTVFASVWVKNVGSPLVNQIPLRLKVNNANDIIEIINVTLNPGDSIYYTFKKGFIVPKAIITQPYYLLSVQSELSCDANSANNRKTFNGRIIITDISVTKIEKPAENICDTGLHYVYASIELTNIGDSNITGIRLIVHIDSGNVRVKDLARTITVYANSSETFEFSTPYKVPNIKDSNETYQVTAYINAINKDMDNTNDTLRQDACVVYNPGFGIDQYKGNGWFVGQNKPNPASLSTTIPYFVPYAGEIVFKITTVKGQMLYQEILYPQGGNHELLFQTDKLANGIYYYSMEYQGEVIIKKMTIQK
ncbi:MAG: hypothetical protein WCZ21_01665, partial [Bacteroidales bacterium]